jgi:aspartokinase/homoserine dehydrogenase 1
MRAGKLEIGIHKFGGASLTDAASFRHAVGIIRQRKGARAVVVSAPAGVTDALLGLAGRAAAGRSTDLERDAQTLRARYRKLLQGLVPAGKARDEVGAEIDRCFDELEGLLRSLVVLSELTSRTSDFVLARGERLSARLFSAALNAAGTRSRYVDAVDVVITDGPFGGASPNLMLTDLTARKILRPLLAAGIVPVVPGFLGATPGADSDDRGRMRAVATLGRGGSDLTATLLGRALGAQDINLWKDVPGLLTADPRVVPDARVIPQLNVREASELAYFGAKVLHPRALIPIATTRPIPVYVRPFADPTAAGTEISARRTLDRYPVKALSAAGGQALITVTGNGMLGVPGIAARTFAALYQEGTSVSLITQSSSEQSICFSVPEASARRACQRLTEVFREEIGRHEIDGVTSVGGLATLAVVGIGMAGHPGIAARVFGALSSAAVNIVAIAQGSSELNISFVVAARDATVAQRAIHDAFQLAKIGGGAAARSQHVDAVLLGFGQIGRALAGMIAKTTGESKAGARARVRAAAHGNANGAAHGNGKAARPTLRLVAAIDRGGFVFDPQGLSPRVIGALIAGKTDGKGFAELPGGQRAQPSEALAFVGRHALSDPILVDVTADETGPIIKQALTAGMDVVLANKRPLSGPRHERTELETLARAHGRRILFEATVGAGLPILDTHRKLAESGDKVIKIEGCLSGTLGFLLTEIGRGKPFSAALRKAMAMGYTEPDPRDDLSGADVGRKALILGRLLGFAGEPADVVVESLVSEASRALPLPAFLEQLEQLDAEWGRRLAAARERGGQLRYVASVTRNKVTVGLTIVDATSPFAALKGSDNQVAFTTARYRENPLVITGPGAGPAVTAAGVLNDILGLIG